MKVKDKKWIRIRIYLVAIFFIFGLSITLSRAIQLQIFERERLKAIASSGYRTIVKLPPKRGIIFDRERHELAVSVEVGSVYANPGQVKDKVKTAKQLALILNEPGSRFLSLLRKDSSFVWIKRKIPPQKINQIKELDLDGVGFTSETRRYYPGRDIAGHLLGLVGADNQGLEGLEKKYDEILRGPQQTLVQMRDAIKRPFFVSKPTETEKDIHNIILTIDKDIQYKAQLALERAVEKAKGKSGQCIIMDPETGEILAMAIAPSFNPNIFSQYGPSQWRNRAVTDCYEPGSAIKVFLLATALEKNIVSPNTRFNCENGEYRISNRIIHDTKRHQVLSASEIVVRSSNIGAIKIGQELGYARFYEYLKKFGFGAKTGVDLIGERSGSIRTPDSAKEVDQATVYFGQGMSGTSLQLINAMAAIANGGRLMRPYVVKAVTDETGRITREYYPHMIRRAISPGTAKKVTSILKEVVTDKGTAPMAAIEGYSVAGKTSTAEKYIPGIKAYSDKDYVAIFVGFVPADRPKLVILVMIDEPRGQIYGGVVAGPVFKDVGKWALNNLRIQPELKVASLVNETRADIPVNNKQKVFQSPEVLNFLPDFKGLTMREVLKTCSRLGLEINLKGTGLAVEQIPEPGAPLEGVTSVMVSFEPPV
jgi:cell division protein FtsI (penicillin-binding protein 3)